MTKQYNTAQETLKKAKELQELIQQNSNSTPIWQPSHGLESFYPVLPESHTTYALPALPKVV